MSPHHLVAAALLAGSVLVAAAGSTPAAAATDPPFDGTIFLDPDIITASDPTAFEDLTATGRGSRVMFDRRVGAFVDVNAYLFAVSFDDGLTTEIQVNPEFGSQEAAAALAERFGPIVGQLPTALRADVAAVWIQGGTELFGGGNDALLIHVGQADVYEAAGILEETLVHEAAHTSLDAQHAASPGWLAAQQDDPTFISTYARDNPTREDIAESVLPYLALRYRADRIDASLAETIRATMPHRIAYFDRQGLALGTLAGQARVRSRARPDGWVRETLAGSGVGARVDSVAATVRVGVDARGREYRAILSFDTSALPNRSVVTGLALRLRQQGSRGNPVSELGGFSADVAKGGFGTPSLSRHDFDARATRTISQVAAASDGDVLVLDLVSARRAVSPTGLTQVRLRFAEPQPGYDLPHLLELASGDAARSLRPVLIIQYGTR